MSHPKVILIGGPPSSGKSTLARAIATRLGYGCISTDDIGLSVRTTTTAESHPGLHSMNAGNHRDYFVNNSAEWLLEDAMRAHAEIWPAIEAIIQAHTVGYFADPVIIEGMALWPERVAALEYPGVASFWLGMSAEELEARTWESIEFDYAPAEAREVTAKFIARNVIWNELMLEACERLGMKVVDTNSTRSPDHVAQLCIERFGL
jgi:2-phosphoglycerate kinase